MKLLRYGPAGIERPGLLDAAGRIRDLSAHVHDIAGTALLPASLQRLAAVDQARLPLVDAGERLGPCVAKVGKLVVVEGRPVGQHALYLLAPSALSGARDAVMLPPGLGIRCAVRLGVVIGQRARGVAAAETLRHVAGYCLLADIQPVDAKAAARRHLDTFAPLGPWLVTHGEAGTFEVATAVSYVSECMSLEPGDVLSLPVPGAALPRALPPGERLRLSIDGLGEQLLHVVARPGHHPL